jgi:hypothetical protein
LSKKGSCLLCTKLGITNLLQLSFTIDDLLEGDEGKETLQFDLRLTRLSEVGAVVCDMLDHVFETKDKLKVRFSTYSTLHVWRHMHGLKGLHSDAPNVMSRSNWRNQNISYRRRSQLVNRSQA